MVAQRCLSGCGSRTRTGPCTGPGKRPAHDDRQRLTTAERGGPGSAGRLPLQPGSGLVHCHGSQGPVALLVRAAVVPGLVHGHAGGVTAWNGCGRGIATRHGKTATVHLAGLHAAGVFLRSAR